MLQKDSRWISETADAFGEVTGELLSWERRVHYGLEREKGKERQAKVLSYLYNVVWMCRKKNVGHSGDWRRLPGIGGFGNRLEAIK